MEEYQITRMETLNKYKDFINGMIVGKQKGIMFRRRFRNYLFDLAFTTFKDDDEQYENISKFGRGPWDEEQIFKAFNEEERNTIVEIAKGFGAFDY